MKDFLTQLLNNALTNRISSTRFSYFVITLLAALLILACIVVMLADVCKEGKIQTDYFSGISQIILSAAVLILCAGIPKALCDKFQHKIDKL